MLSHQLRPLSGDIRLPALFQYSTFLLMDVNSQLLSLQFCGIDIITSHLLLRCYALGELVVKMQEISHLSSSMFMEVRTNKTRTNKIRFIFKTQKIRTIKAPKTWSSDFFLGLGGSKRENNLITKSI